MYEIGKVYVWQGQPAPFDYLNGTETVILGAPEQIPTPLFGTTERMQRTDTPAPAWLLGAEGNAYAGAGDLRPKGTPGGEQSVLDLFKLPEAVPA